MLWPQAPEEVLIMTRAEKLRDKFGGKVVCDECLTAKVYSDKWRMSEGGIIVCPECAQKLAREQNDGITGN